MSAAELNPEFRNLIDARLDAIERILLRVQVSYSERRHILGEVETQIFELLARRSANPGSQDVLAVLDSLDPPEAYIPEEFRGRLGDVASKPVPPPPRGPRISKFALGSALGVAVVFLIGLGLRAMASVVSESDSEAVIGTLVFVVTICGSIATMRIVYSQGRLLGLPFALLAAILFPLLYVNYMLALALAHTQGVGPWVITAAALLCLNYLGVQKLWRSISNRAKAYARHSPTSPAPMNYGNSGPGFHAAAPL
jgi:hypothetical protein